MEAKKLANHNPQRPWIIIRHRRQQGTQCLHASGITGPEDEVVCTYAVNLKSIVDAVSAALARQRIMSEEKGERGSAHIACPPSKGILVEKQH